MRIDITCEKNRPVIAAPRLICRNAIKRDAFHRQFPQNCARLGFVRAIAHIDADLLRFDKRLHHRAQSRQNAIERIWETDPFSPGP